MSNPVTTTALVLSRLPWSETSQIVTVITPDLGRIGAIARGAKRASGGVGPALEPVTESQIVLTPSTSGTLAHIQSADVQDYFSATKRSLTRIALSLALCELASRATAEGEENRQAFNHLRAVLHGIDSSTDRDAVNWLWWGVLRVIDDLGYGIQVAECARCGSRTTPHRWFAPAEGGPVCGSCTGENLRVWAPETQETLGWLLSTEIDDLPSHRIPKRVNRDIRNLLEDYLQYHVPYFERLKSLDVLAELSYAAS